MVKVIILEGLKDEIIKKFKAESKIIFRQMYSLSDNPQKGKLLGIAGGIVIKELKYKNFRFYFLADGHKLKMVDEAYLTNMLIKFVRISDKKHQQETINEIKKILLNLRPKGFE